MRWQIKWARNAAFGLVPFSGKIRQFKRSLHPYQTAVSSWTLEEGLRQVELLREAGCDLRGASVLEIGSGWQPIIPLLFSLAGANDIVLVDSQRLMDANTFRGTAHNLSRSASLISERLQIPEEDIRHRLSNVSDDLHSQLQQFRLKYLAPFDITTASSFERRFDVITSRAVLEHVPPPVLTRIFNSLLLLLKPEGWTCHAIDNSDHWSHNDKMISRINFLRYSDWWFNLINSFNPLDYQNRLRHSEYLALFKKVGFEVLISRAVPEPQAMNDLNLIPLASRFASFDPTDLACLDSYFVARPSKKKV